LRKDGGKREREREREREILFIFFCSLILVGGLPRLKFVKGEKFPKTISNLALSRWPSI
jgi:hypothetical protein